MTTKNLTPTEFFFFIQGKKVSVVFLGGSFLSGFLSVCFPSFSENSVKELSKLVNKKETDMNKELLQKRFTFRRPSDMLSYLFRIKDKKRRKN